MAPDQIQGFTACFFIDPVVCRTSTAGRCKCGCAICPVQTHKTLHLTNTELKYVCCVALKQSPVKYSLNDAKPVKFFVCHSHQHKIAVLC
ncbi:hypothetical protein KQQSB11_310001 [Klebsiella quasipneumoniae subsp. quasipneumoniae]|nr:hypothetical protein KQQSB11_310001 [Klebsiella quasipneumoniae subsp. quasipneumoniae]